MGDMSPSGCYVPIKLPNARIEFVCMDPGDSPVFDPTFHWLGFQAKKSELEKRGWKITEAFQSVPDHEWKITLSHPYLGRLQTVVFVNNHEYTGTALVYLEPRHLSQLVSSPVRSVKELLEEVVERQRVELEPLSFKLVDDTTTNYVRKRYVAA